MPESFRTAQIHSRKNIGLVGLGLVGGALAERLLPTGQAPRGQTVTGSWGRLVGYPSRDIGGFLDLK